MKEWMTAQEIANQALPDIAATKRGILLMADRENWSEHPIYARERKARGGGMEYHYRLLPPLAQIAYGQRHMVVGKSDAVTSVENVKVETEVLTGRAQRERDARLAILATFERFSRGIAQFGLHQRLQLFSDKYNVGTLAVEDWVKDLVPAVSKRTLMRWRAAKKAGKSAPLAVDHGARRKGTGILETAEGGRLKEWMLALIAAQPALSGDAVRIQCRHKFNETMLVKGEKVPAVRVDGVLVPMPPVRTFQRVIKQLKSDNAVVLVKITNPDEHRSRYAPAGTGSLRYITDPNDLWMIDASPVDALCEDGRHSIYGTVDIATRRFVLSLSRTPRASAVALMMRKAITKLGVPREVKTDNGSDFVAEDTKRLFRFLDIDIDLCEAYSPEQKGHIERAIRTFQHMVGPLLPGYIGHSVEDRKAIESRKSFAARMGDDEKETFSVKLTAAQLQKHIDDWLELVYQHHEHGGLNKRTPFQVAAASNAVIRTVDERALDVLLMPVAGKDGQRMVTKQGIRIDKFYYSTGHLTAAQQVFVRRDPIDMGRVYVFSADGAEFMCEAYCPELAGINPATFQQGRKEIYADRMAKATRQIKSDMREIGKQPLIEKALEVARRDVPNVIVLPKRTEEHSTPQIAAAIVAMSERTTIIDPRVDAEQQRMIDAMTADDHRQLWEKSANDDAAHSAFIEQQRTAHLSGNVVALPETPRERYRRALAVRQRMDANDLSLDFADAKWLGRYETTPEFKGEERMHAAYGESYLEP